VGASGTKCKWLGWNCWTVKLQSLLDQCCDHLGHLYMLAANLGVDCTNAVAFRWTWEHCQQIWRDIGQPAKIWEAPANADYKLHSWIAAGAPRYCCHHSSENSFITHVFCFDWHQCINVSMDLWIFSFMYLLIYVCLNLCSNPSTHSISVLAAGGASG